MSLNEVTNQWKLPPLIVHPFSDPADPNKLLESSRASLMLQGLLPAKGATKEELRNRLLEGRFRELRMLYYIGKDILRWIEQCLDLVRLESDLQEKNIRFQSFASLLVDHPPGGVKTKLKKWGVAESRAIFSRAIGLNSVFSRPPSRSNVTEEFIRNSSRYSDHMFVCRQRSISFDELDADAFVFGLYASGEYTRLLEREWNKK